MEYFIVTRKTGVRIGDRQAVLHMDFLPPKDGTLRSPIDSARHVYFTTQSQLNRLAQVDSVRATLRAIMPDSKGSLENHPRFPKAPAFGDTDANDALFRGYQGKTVRIALVNGIGGSIGDSLVGLRALEIFAAHLADLGISPRFDVFRIKPRDFRSIYRTHPLVHDILALPAPVEKLLGYELYVSFEDLVISRRFNAMPMIDYYLATFGLDPGRIAGARKRLDIRVDKDAAKAAAKVIDTFRAGGRKILLFHPKASSFVRSIPPSFCDRLLGRLRQRDDVRIVCADPYPGGWDGVADLSAASSSIERFIAIVSQVDAIVCADTATYHIADAFDVPTAAVFTTISPALRTPYYPFVVPVEAPVSPALRGRHTATEAECATEIERAFGALDVDDVTDALDLAVAARRAARGGGEAGGPRA